jgi:AAA family ATP:ADP antiporter
MLNKKNLNKYVLSIIDIKEDELKKTLLLQLNIFILISTLLIVKPTINSLFLSELSADALPIGYVLTAFFAIIGFYFYNRLLEKYPLNKIIEGTIVGSIISLIIFGIAFILKLANGYVLYIPYIWVAIFGLLSASQFWILANLVYNIRSAKRVFGFIGAGAIAGGIFGGYLTSLLTTFLDTEILLFVSAFLLVFCLPITRYIWKTEVLNLNTFQISKRTPSKGESAYSLIKQSKLLKLIALVIGLSVLIAKLIDYQYSDYAARLITDQEELTAFFGFWLSTLSVISLLVQLLLTQRIVGTFGVGKSLLWLPSGILIGSTLLLFFPQLWVIVLIKVIDGSLKQSVNKAATELLSIPIPIDIKKKTKSFTEVVVDSIATGIAGLVLIFFVNGLNISSTFISLINIILICIWLYLIYQLRIEYVISFKKLIQPEQGRENRSSRKEIEITSIIGSVIKVLNNGTDRQIVHMLHKTMEVKDERFFPAIKKLLKHDSSVVRTLAIDNLYFLHTENLCEQIESMVYDDDQAVTTSAFRYLLKKYDKDPLVLFSKYLDTEDETISNAALIGLSLELRNKSKLQNLFNLEKRIDRVLYLFEKSTAEEFKNNKMQAILEAIGNSKLESHYYVIVQQLSSKFKHLQQVAILSAAQTLDQQFIPQIVPFLNVKESRKFAQEALLTYGIPIIDIFEKRIIEERYEPEIAIQIILVIEKFASQKAINTLMRLTDETEHSIKIEAIEALKRMKWKYSELVINDRYIVDKILDECELYQNTLSVIHSQKVIQQNLFPAVSTNAELKEAQLGLLQLLEQRLDRQLQRIFKFLGVKYPPNDVDPILDIILKGKEQQRVYAIEFLDNLLDNQLRKELIPIAESALIESNYEEKIKKLHLKLFNEVECYNTLLTRKDNRLKLAVLYLIEKSGDDQYWHLLELVKNDRNIIVKNKANALLQLKNRALQR